MSDQAQILRGLVEKQALVAVPESPRLASRARTIAITSGKGGVGKSNVALNLAIALQQGGAEVCLLDVNLGLGNIDLLCGINGYWNLSHVVSGVRSLSEVSLDGPSRVRIISGVGSLTEVADYPLHVQRELLSQLEEIEQTHDFLILDTGTGMHSHIRRFITAADAVVVLTTPEPTSIADSYSVIKALSSSVEIPILEVVVNQARSREEAAIIQERLQETARVFLHTEVGEGGFIPFDSSIQQAVNRQSPFLIQSPRCAASRAIEQLARRLKNVVSVKTTNSSFFSRVLQQRKRSDAA